MAKHTDPILILGATGQQGGTVASELLRRGHQVHALVRDPAATAAKALASDGATLVRGDLNDPTSLRQAMSGGHPVFSVQTFMGPDGLAGEVRQGKAVVDAAADTGVRQLVYSSVDGAERDSGVPHFATKWSVEQYLRQRNVPATILRPVFFMENFIDEDFPHAGLVRQALPAERDLQLVSVIDIGVFAADAFENPSDYLGRAMAIAGDELNGSQIAETFSTVTGTNTEYQQQPLSEVEAFSDDMAAMVRWFDTAGYQADIASLRQSHPGLLSLREWLRRHTDNNN